jgi:hypothetical protein
MRFQDVPHSVAIQFHFNRTLFHEDSFFNFREGILWQSPSIAQAEVLVTLVGSGFMICSEI